MEIETWNALLDRAIESIGQAKDEFVKEAEYHRAAVARDLAEVLQEMRS